MNLRANISAAASNEESETDFRIYFFLRPFGNVSGFNGESQNIKKTDLTLYDHKQCLERISD